MRVNLQDVVASAWTLGLFAQLFAEPSVATEYVAGPPAMVMMLLASGMQVVGQQQAARAQERQERINQQLAEQAAMDARLRGQQDELRVRRRASLVTGAQRAATGASGIAVDEGTAYSVTEDVAAMAELDILNIRNNAEREAWGLSVQGQQFGYAGQVARSSATTKSASTILGAGAELFQMVV